MEEQEKQQNQESKATKMSQMIKEIFEENGLVIVERPPRNNSFQITFIAPSTESDTDNQHKD